MTIKSDLMYQSTPTMIERSVAEQDYIFSLKILWSSDSSLTPQDEEQKRIVDQSYIVALAMVGIAALAFLQAAKFPLSKGTMEKHGRQLYLKYIPIVADRGDILQQTEA
jgi:hypothetical protein